MNLKCRLTTDELIELAETGKTRNIVLDSMAATVFRDCLNMLEFEEVELYRKKLKTLRSENTV